MALHHLQNLALVLYNCLPSVPLEQHLKALSSGLPCGSVCLAPKASQQLAWGPPQRYGRALYRPEPAGLGHSSRLRSRELQMLQEREVVLAAFLLPHLGGSTWIFA